MVVHSCLSLVGCGGGAAILRCIYNTPSAGRERKRGVSEVGGNGSWELARPTRHPHHGLALSVAWLLLAWLDGWIAPLSSSSLSPPSCSPSFPPFPTVLERPTPSVSLPFRFYLNRASLSVPFSLRLISSGAACPEKFVTNVELDPLHISEPSSLLVRGTGIRRKSTIQGQLQTVPVLVWSRSVPS